MVTFTNQDSSSQTVVRYYDGLNRLGYFGWGLVLLIGAVVGYGVAFGLFYRSTEAGGILLVLVSLAVFAAATGLQISRMENMGMSLGLKVLHLVLMVIPLVGIYPTVFLSSAPTGFMQHRKYDTAGKIIIAVLVTLYIGAWVAPQAFR
jgi:uncharacterized membrane protein YhaH (DUF805 family)